MTHTVPRLSNRRLADRYQIDSFIAQGGMGEVYRGRDNQTGQTVAIKHLSQAAIRDPELLLERFRRESEALRLLNHPNIVALHAALEERGEYYLIMDYIGGGSLADRLADGTPLPISQVIAIGLDVADALTRSHRLKIVHRDLKPANILLDTDGTPRLTDFGVALMGGESPVTEAGTVLGTLAYLSPEALGGESLDARADIWAFGVVLYELLTGQVPFTGETISTQIAAILNAPVPDLETIRRDVPLPLVDLIYRMLDKDKLTRIGSMRQVGAELEGLQSDSPARTQVIHIRPKVFSTPNPTPTPTPAGASSRARARRNLPAQSTPFVGREDELAELDRLLIEPDTRLITILGPGGMGKTRLSIEAADLQSHHTSDQFPDGRFPDGVYFAALAPLLTPELIVTAIGESVRFQFYQGGNERGQLIDFLREKTLLLVLDNFEHLMAGADLVVDILREAPNVKIIVTSRERLNVQGETLFRLDGMGFPDWETPEDALRYSAIQLFVQSARRARPGFVLITEQLAYIARICRLVQGLPLGILLAAAWVDSLSLAEIAEEIGKNIDFLETESRDVPTRQRSLRAVFDYSWNLLAPDDQTAFMQLSVFRGGFTREAGQEVTGASLRTLNALINKSLLRRDAAGRYEVHELLRQFAAQRLAADPEQEARTQAAHSQYYAAFVARQLPRYTNREQVEAVRATVTEMDNIRAAWQTGIVQRNLSILQQAAEGLIVFYLRYEQNETSLRLFQATADGLRLAPQTGDYPHMLGLMLGAAGFFKAFTGQREDARRNLIEADALIPAAVYPRHRAMLQIFWVLPKVLADESVGETHQQSFDRLQTALDLAEGLHDDWLIATVQSLIAWMYGAQGDYQRGADLTALSLSRMRAMGDELGQIGGLFSTGWRAVYRGDYTEARAAFADTERIHRTFNAQRALGFTLLSLSEVGLHTGEHADARAKIDEAIAIFRQIGDRRGVIISTSNLARLSEQEGDLTEAIRLFTETVESSRSFAYTTLLATALSLRAHAERTCGQIDAARRDWSEALNLSMRDEAIRVVLEALAGLADLLIRAESAQAKERGAVILGFVDVHPALTSELRDAVQESLAAVRESIGAAAVQSATQPGVGMTLADIANLAR